MKSSQLKGKKLVVLGGAANESTLVKRAQELGIYVIVADYYKDISLSPAKAYADEAWDVNWTDVDEMVRLCRAHGIDGVIAGYSEVKIDYLIRICEALGLPCYCTKEQLEITRNKRKFKEECRKCGVPVVVEYDDVNAVSKYPVIVKPVDRAGSIGVGIAHNHEELVLAYDNAMEKSYTKDVIIEEYITAQKIDAYYLVDQGRISLLTSNDVIMAANNSSSRVVQSCWLYPHRRLDVFSEKVDSTLRMMIQDMGIQYGCIFFSGFIDEKQNYTFFECGFRLEGAHQYNYTYNRGDVNFLDVFISHALTGGIECVEANPQKRSDLKLVVVNIYAKAGKIGAISGEDAICAMDDCSLAMIKANLGDNCKDDEAILTKVAMFEFNHESPDVLADDVDKAYSVFTCLDTDGNDMVYDRVDSMQIRHWWD